MLGSAVDDDVDAKSSGEEVESGQLDGDGTSVAAFDMETVLVDAGALESDESGDELRLASLFEPVWNDEIARTNEVVARRWLARLIGVDEANTTPESCARNR